MTGRATNRPSANTRITAAKAMVEAVQTNRVVLSLAHNMAQPNQVSAAMIDVLTEYIHDNRITAEEGQKRLADAVENVR